MTTGLEQGIKPGPNYEVNRTPRLSPEMYDRLSPIDQQLYLIAAAQKFASTHNTQPVAYELDPGNSRIRTHLNRGQYYFDKKGRIVNKRRVLEASDTDGRQALISAGFALANLEIAAQLAGQAEIELRSIDPNQVKPLTKPDMEPIYHYTPLAELSITHLAHPKMDPADLDAIFTRRMNRKRYNPARAIPQTILEQSQLNAHNLGVTLHTVVREGGLNAQKMDRFADLQGIADSIVVNKKSFVEELADDWFILNDSLSGLGMPGDTFALSDTETKRIYHNLKTGTLTVDDKRGFGSLGKEGIYSAYSVNLLLTDHDTPEEWIQVGRALGRNAHLLEKNGIAMAIHAGLAEVGGLPTLGLKTVLGVLSNKRTANLYRSGYALYPAFYAPRLPAKEVLI